MSGHLVTHWAYTGHGPVARYIGFRFARSCLLKAALFIEIRKERSIIPGFSHLGDFNSIIPAVGVILSNTPHPQFGHLLDTQISFFFFSAIFIISQMNIQDFVWIL